MALARCKTRGKSVLCFVVLDGVLDNFFQLSFPLFEPQLKYALRKDSWLRPFKAMLQRSTALPPTSAWTFRQSNRLELVQVSVALSSCVSPPIMAFLTSPKIGQHTVNANWIVIYHTVYYPMCKCLLQINAKFRGFLRGFWNRAMIFRLQPKPATEPQLSCNGVEEDGAFLVAYHHSSTRSLTTNLLASRWPPDHGTIWPLWSTLLHGLAVVILRHVKSASQRYFAYISMDGCITPSMHEETI